eukprot:Tbor_TRINITY_DN3203_c0_g1::TRINITY_DN3203_c0_g1_i1::g.23751::m.23751
MTDNVGDSIIMERVGINVELINRLRSSTAVVAGASAGILGITGWLGFVFFILHALLSSTVIHMICGGAETSKKNLVGSTKELFSLSSLITGGLTFVFVWTIVYDSIFIF